MQAIATRLPSIRFFGANAGIDHIFRLGNLAGGVLLINPSAAINAGTQNFSKTYLEQKKLLILPVGEETVTQNSQRFAILSYELSTALAYAYGKLNLFITPAYVVPLNVLNVPGRPELSENAKKLFYITAQFRFTF